ncbi:MAG: RteC domain-containing protein [Paludibacter sp.]|nr:RteC domain-containing protein [Paludibacter sp.]
MNHFITKLNKDLNNELQTIDIEESDLTKKAQKSVRCIKNALTQLKAFTVKYTFCNQAQEIHFFREIKPEFFSKLIYYVKIFNIESRRPMGTHEIQETYLRHELEKLTFFFNNHLEFYQYYRMDSTFLDDKYFMRGKDDLHLYHDSLMFYVDPDFSTSHDYMVAKIIAYDRLEVFLNTELEALSIKSANPNWGQLGISGNNMLQWTDSKTSLVELVYALHAAGVLNNGHCEIRELSAFFEQAFNTHLIDIYRTFLEIKIRSAPTKFIDTLKDALLRKMEEES